MRKFKFRLESVLKYRQEERDQARNLYIEAQQRRFEMDDQIREVEQVRKENLRGPANDLPSRLSLQSWVDNLDNQQHQFQVALEILLQEEEHAMQVWIERRQEAEALEKMRARQLQEHLLEVARFEQNELDEWATMRKKVA